MEFHFKKKYGQNFLADENLLGAIVRDAGVDETATVLEIGAGAGALTRVLAERAACVLSYEIDRELRPVLERALSGCRNVEVLFCDFMREEMGEVERALKGPYRVVANLPYYITTPVLMRFCEEAQNCLGLTVMVQEEVARRLCARENTPDYGAITAALALKGRARITRRVPRTMFTPRPNVDSAVVTVEFDGGLAVKSASAYRFAVRTAFSNRRKTLENNLMSAAGLTRAEAKEILAQAEIPEGARGETLSPATFARFSDLLFDRGIGKGN